MSMNATLKNMLYGAGVATILFYIFDEELQPVVNKVKEMAEKIHPSLAFNADGINEEGDVLIGGLGIGFVNQKLIDNPNVTSVTIVEKNQEVIDLVWNSCPKDGTFTIIQDDIETWEPTSHYDVAWFDTWLTANNMTKEEYDEFITEKYTTHCSWIGVWVQIN